MTAAVGERNLSLRFQGWCQYRLATDPDPTNEPRGVSGYTYALAGEPDLDAVIRTHDPVAPRSHTPQIGVTVRAVMRGSRKLRNHPLEGAAVRLLGNPRLWARNYVIAAPGCEPLDPVELEVSNGGLSLLRKDILDPKDPSLTVMQATQEIFDRRTALAAGAFAPETIRTLFPRWKHASLKTGSDPWKKAVLGKVRDYRARRRKALIAELQRERDETKRAALGKRVSELEVTDAMDRRVIALTGIQHYSMELNGPVTIEDADGVLVDRPDTRRRWRFEFWWGAWDADALSMHMSGRLDIPVRASR